MLSRRRINRWARTFISQSPIPAALRATGRHLRVVLYHDIGEPSEYTGKVGVSVRRDVFEDHMTLLGKNYDFVSIDDVISGELPDRPLLVTFDDGFRSVLTEASPITERLGVRPLLFVATSPVFEGEIILDNLLSMAETRCPEVLLDFTEKGVAPTAKSILSRQLTNRTASERRAFRDRLAARLNLTPKTAAEESGIYLDPDDLLELKSRGFDFGTHTHSHIHLRGLGADEFESEISRPTRLMQELLGPISPTFSVPFGSRTDLSPEIVRRLSELGIQKMFLVEGMINRDPRSSILCRHSLASMKTVEINADIEVFARMRRKDIPALR